MICDWGCGGSDGCTDRFIRLLEAIVQTASVRRLQLVVVVRKQAIEGKDDHNNFPLRAQI